MKKKILILSLASGLTLGAVASTLLINKNGGFFGAKSEDDFWSISFDGLDLVKELDGAAKTSDVVLKTDQNKNDVTFHYENCSAYELNGTNYFNVQAGGSLANTTELRGMTSFHVQAMGEFKLEWGFAEVDDKIFYESSVTFYEGNNVYEFDFEGTKPNYFKITNVDTAKRQLAYFEIKMDKECKSSSSPYVYDSGLKFKKSDSYVTCLGFAGTSLSTLNIPSEVDGLPVKAIGDNAFKGDADITSLTLPNSLLDIGTSAFQDCENIGAITIPKSVTTIRPNAFENTTNCTTLSFESGGTETLSLGRAAFYSCGHTGVLTLPSRVSDLSYDGYVFAAMMGVTNYAVNNDNNPSNIISVEDGVLFAAMGNYSHNTKVLVSYPRANSRTVYTIPSDCTKVMTQDGLSSVYGIEKLIIDNDVELLFDANSASSMVSLEEIEFKESEHNVYFYWYCLNYAPNLRGLLVPDNLVVNDSGLARVNQAGLSIYLPGSDIPTSWHTDWCESDDITNGYIKVYSHNEVEPATTEEKLATWHFVDDVPTPYAISVNFCCYRTDIGDGYAFYLLGVDSWTASEANRGAYNNDSGRWEVTMVMVPNTTYSFKGAISTWDNPVSISYEVGDNRSWTPDRFSKDYTVDWHY